MKKILTIAIILVLTAELKAQSNPKNPYNLPVIQTVKAYKKSVAENPNKALVDLEKYIPGIVLDIKYATNDNVTGVKMYNSARAFVRKPVAEALKQIQAELNQQGLGLHIHDAYRPFAATLTLYNAVKDTNFVAPPWRGSRHNRGCAVDLTVIDLKTKKQLDMPTEIDAIDKKAYVSYTDLPEEALKNRRMLIEIMERHGFKVYPNEWWHYDFKGWKNYEILDIPFEKLDK